MDDELDRMLSPRDEIVPSSGFVASVMEAVRHEEAASAATVFPPISFPWLRALPVFVALAAGLAMLVAGFVKFVRMPTTGSGGSLLPPGVEQALTQTNAGWIALALLLAFLCTFFSIRLAVGKQ